MSSVAPGEITRLLLAWQDGDENAFNRVVALTYDELRRISRRQLRRSNGERTLDTTALVHEAYLKLVGDGRPACESSRHFLGIAARAMRQILVDHARRRHAEKRGGGQLLLALDEEIVAAPDQPETLIMIDEALRTLAVEHERLVRVVECRLFAGFTEQETAAALDIAPRTVRHHWMLAKAWLRERLGNTTLCSKVPDRAH